MNDDNENADSRTKTYARRKVKISATGPSKATKKVISVEIRRNNSEDRSQIVLDECHNIRRATNF